MSDHDPQLHEDIGFIKGSLESIEKHLDKLNKTTEKNTQNITKHDVIIGKVGVVLTGIVFLFTAIFNFAIEWVKRQFL